MLRLSLRVLAVLLVLYLVLLLAAWIFQRSLIYLPDASDPGSAPEGFSELEFAAADGLRLTAWLAAPSGPERSAAVLFAPGNAGNRSDRVPLARALAAEGFAVLLLDYRGYGGNLGDPDEAGLNADVEAGHAALLERGFPPESVLLFGESLGCGPIAALAARTPAAAVVLRSPFADLAAAAAEAYPIFPVRMLLKDRYPVEADVADARAEVTVVYGESDRLIPPEQSRAVAAAAAGPTVAVPGADHNDAALAHGPMLIEATTDAADSAGLRPEP